MKIERQRRLQRDHRLRHPRRLRPGQRDQPLAPRAVSDLVVVLRADDESPRRQVRRGRPVLAGETGLVLPLVEPAALQGRGQGRQRLLVVAVVPLRLPRQRNVQRVVQIVRPDSVEALLLDQARIVLVALRDRELSLAVHRLGDLAQDVLGRIVLDAVHRIEPQPVEVAALGGHPAQGILDEEAPHGRNREVDRVAPRRLVPVGEVGPVLREVVPLGAEMIVYHI